MRKKKYKNIAKLVIQNEIEGLKKLKSSIGFSFEKMIQIILNVGRDYLKDELGSIIKNKTTVNEEIMHMIINKYFIKNKSYLSFQENLKSDHLALEIQFKSISNNIIYDLNKILENYQIKIIKYLDGIYVKNFFKDNIDISLMNDRGLDQTISPELGSREAISPW